MITNSRGEKGGTGIRRRCEFQTNQISILVPVLTSIRAGLELMDGLESVDSRELISNSTCTWGIFLEFLLTYWLVIGL